MGFVVPGLSSMGWRLWHWLADLWL